MQKGAALMSTSVEGSAYTDEEIADAQRELDAQPDFSPFWESRRGQDALSCIIDCKLEPTTTEQARREMHRQAMAEARELCE